MTLVFKSDGLNEGKGFEAQYTTANNATRLDPQNCRYVICSLKLGCHWCTKELPEGARFNFLSTGDTFRKRTPCDNTLFK